jgi:hypothetical protein
MPERCLNCGSTDTKTIMVKPPVRTVKRGESGHRCTPDCERPALFCRTCRLAR